MLFIGNGSNTIALINFFTNGVGAIFSSLDTIQFLDAPFSILDVFIAVILWRLIMWYILRIISGKDTSDSLGDTEEQQKEKRFEQYLSDKDVEVEYGVEGDE